MEDCGSPTCRRRTPLSARSDHPSSGPWIPCEGVCMMVWVCLGGHMGKRVFAEFAGFVIYVIPF